MKHPGNGSTVCAARSFQLVHRDPVTMSHQAELEPAGSLRPLHLYRQTAHLTKAKPAANSLKHSASCQGHKAHTCLGPVSAAAAPEPPLRRSISEGVSRPEGRLLWWRVWNGDGSELSWHALRQPALAATSAAATAVLRRPWRRAQAALPCTASAARRPHLLCMPLATDAIPSARLSVSNASSSSSCRRQNPHEIDRHGQGSSEQQTLCHGAICPPAGFAFIILIRQGLIKTVEQTALADNSKSQLSLAGSRHAHSIAQ